MAQITITKVMVMVEEHVTPKMMILPRNWHVYSSNKGSFCHISLGWLGFNDKIPEGYESKYEVWIKGRVYVNEALANSRNGCRLRILYRWKCETVMRKTQRHKI